MAIGARSEAGSPTPPPRSPGRIPPLAITAYTVSSALGAGLAENLQALRARRSGLRPNDFTEAPLATWVGRVAGLEAEPLPRQFEVWDCRNNRLAWLALQQDGFIDAIARARTRYGPERIALLLGTSTSSIGATEEAYRHLTPEGRFPEQLRQPIIHTAHSLGAFVQYALGLTGICATVTTACSSSAKVFAQAERMIRCGVADAAVVGGVDTLCGSVLFGFNSLELVSADPCRPFDINRRGISIGESGGFALLESERAGPGPWLLGYGESSDAYHMSSPHPEGLGARLAINDALARSGLASADVGYINLHGTASARNDEVEACVIAELFPATTHASSTKGWTGHTLGAAGFLEAAITLLAISDGMAPGNLNTTELDPACGPQIRIDNAPLARPVALSQSFGFGGSNCVLAFGAGRIE
ncbi:MAG: beta-ketoacyl-[acyl-carrier-protein] synthase [Steroidobacteraceae bacterium]|nr:beta-ketoacyl-[acyl-carrier-protein] synthase [Steroidobacteraceae bacterium]